MNYDERRKVCNGAEVLPDGAPWEFGATGRHEGGGPAKFGTTDGAAAKPARQKAVDGTAVELPEGALSGHGNGGADGGDGAPGTEHPQKGSGVGVGQNERVPCQVWLPSQHDGGRTEEPFSKGAYPEKQGQTDGGLHVAGEN